MRHPVRMLSLTVTSLATVASLITGITTANAAPATTATSIPTFPTSTVNPWTSISTLPGNFAGNFNGFYERPATFPHTPGSVVRTQPFTGYLTRPTGANPRLAIRGERVMYTSTTSDSRPILTTGAYLAPTSDWTGKGEAPLLVFAPGTLGLGSQCAASKSVGSLLTFSSSLDSRQDQGKQLLSLIANYETFTILKILAAGYRVFVIDYLGGSDGPQAYVNNIEAGHAILDGARAARQLRKITPRTPIGLWGYSQGGAAAALGATLHSRYAPDVNLQAAYAGAPPIDLIEVNRLIDGTMITAGALMGLNGFAARFPDVAAHVDSIMNEKGKEVLARLAHECIADSVFSTAYTQTKDLLKDGRALYEHMRDTPLMRRHMDQQLAAGRLTPRVPLLVISNPYDDIVSYRQVEVSNRRWCAAGAKTVFLKYTYDSHLPGTALAHMMPGFGGATPALAFMNRIFNGATLTKCVVQEKE